MSGVNPPEFASRDWLNQAFAPVKAFPKLNIAFSGGGDSTALLHLACSWGQKPVRAFIVDHGLREDSAKEAELAASRAEEMGAEAVLLKWQSDGVSSAIQAQARRARYRLFSEAGLTQVWTGHTRDDQRETLLMRLGSGTGWRGLAGMAPVTTGTVWPEAAFLSCHRPLLGVTRQTLRDYLTANQLEYIDDPSNEDLIYERVRRRAFLGGDADLQSRLDRIMDAALTARSHQAAWLRTNIARFVGQVEGGGLVLQPAVKDLPDVHKTVLIQAVLTAVSGRSQMSSAGPDVLGDKATTHSGCRIIPGPQGWLVVREPAAMGSREGGPFGPSFDLTPGHSHIWDGRFVIRAQTDGLRAAPLWPDRHKLDFLQYHIVGGFDRYVRPSLPAIFRGSKIAVLSGEESKLGQIKPITDLRLGNLLN